MHTISTGRCGIDANRVRPKTFKIYNLYFSSKHEVYVFREQIEDRLIWSQNNVSRWDVTYLPACDCFCEVAHTKYLVQHFGWSNVAKTINIAIHLQLPPDEWIHPRTANSGLLKYFFYIMANKS